MYNCLVSYFAILLFWFFNDCDICYNYSVFSVYDNQPVTVLLYPQQIWQDKTADVQIRPV